MATARKKTTRRRGKKAEAEASNGNGVSGGNGAADPVFAEDHVLKLSSTELDKFNLLRLQVENKLQAIRVQELEQDRVNRDYVHQKHVREQLMASMRRDATVLEQQYRAYAEDLAKKFKIGEPRYMAIDDETGVVQDLRPKDTADPG